MVCSREQLASQIVMKLPTFFTLSITHHTIYNLLTRSQNAYIHHTIYCKYSSNSLFKYSKIIKTHLFNFHRLTNNLINTLFVRLLLQMTEHETCKVTMQSLKCKTFLQLLLTKSSSMRRNPRSFKQIQTSHFHNVVFIIQVVKCCENTRQFRKTSLEFLDRQSATPHEMFYLFFNLGFSGIYKWEFLTSSLEISSLLCVNPGMRPRFLSQNIAAKLPEKKIPET